MRLDVQTSGDVSIRGQLGDGEKIHARAGLGGLDGAAAVNLYLAPKNARVNGTLLFGSGEDPSVTVALLEAGGENKSILVKMPAGGVTPVSSQSVGKMSKR